MLFELLPYPMHIVITFLKPSKFYITSKNQRPVTSTSGKVGGARLRRFGNVHYRSAKKNYAARAWHRHQIEGTNGFTVSFERQRDSQSLM